MQLKHNVAKFARGFQYSYDEEVEYGNVTPNVSQSTYLKSSLVSNVSVFSVHARGMKCGNLFIPSRPRFIRKAITKRDTFLSAVVFVHLWFVAMCK